MKPKSNYSRRFGSRLLLNVHLALSIREECETMMSVSAYQTTAKHIHLLIDIHGCPMSLPLIEDGASGFANTRPHTFISHAEPSSRNANELRRPKESHADY